jgi:hypothetical protein
MPHAAINEGIAKKELFSPNFILTPELNPVYFKNSVGIAWPAKKPL